MRKVMMALLAVGAITALSTPSVAAQPQNREPYCYSTLPCVPTTEGQYDSCTNLAVQRGWNLASGRSRNFKWFIYQCLTGKIPR
jgi:hypothetical protein